MTYTIVPSDEYIEHHGILGQKWGVRRYQNKDGSYTTEGANRYRTGKISGPTAEQKAKMDKYFKPGKDGKPSQAEKVASSTKDIIDNTKKLTDKGFAKSKKSKEIARRQNEEISKMSDDELRRKINRMNLEKQYRDLSPKQVSKGQAVVRETLEVAGSIAGITLAATKIYSIIKHG